MDKVKVTVVKRMNMNEIYGNSLPAQINTPIAAPLCDQFKEGQEFIMGMNCPPDFCSWAYADIQRDIIHILMGGDYFWMNEKGVAISCCTDGLRPVVFRIERIKAENG